MLRSICDFWGDWMRRRSTGDWIFDDEVFVLSASVVDERGVLLVAITIVQMMKVLSIQGPCVKQIGVLVTFQKTAFCPHTTADQIIVIDLYTETSMLVFLVRIALEA